MAIPGRVKQKMEARKKIRKGIIIGVRRDYNDDIMFRVVFKVNRLKKYLRRNVSYLLILALLAVTCLNSTRLRSIGFHRIPDTDVILDEFTNVWHCNLSFKVG